MSYTQLFEALAWALNRYFFFLNIVKIVYQFIQIRHSFNYQIHLHKIKVNLYGFFSSINHMGNYILYQFYVIYSKNVLIFYLPFLHEFNSLHSVVYMYSRESHQTIIYIHSFTLNKALKLLIILY